MKRFEVSHRPLAGQPFIKTSRFRGGYAYILSVDLLLVWKYRFSAGFS